MASAGIPGPRSATTITGAVAGRLERDLHRAARGMVPGIVQEVAQDPVEAARIRVHDQRSRRERDGGLGQARRHGAGHHAAEVHGLGGEQLGAGVEPGDLHEVVHERPQAAHVGDQELRRTAGLRRHAAEILLEQGGLGDERRQRRPQLVRDVRHEPPVLLLRGLETRDRRLERVGHPVELRGPPAHLVAAPLRDPGGQVAAGDATRRAPGLGHGSEQPARDDPGDEQRDADRHRSTHQQPRPELGEGGLDGLRGEDEEQVRRPALPAADHEDRFAGQVLPGVAQLPAAHDRPHVRRDCRKRSPEGRRLVRRAIAEVGQHSAGAAQREGRGEPAGLERASVRRAGVRAREQHGQVVVHLLTCVGDEPGAQRGIDERVDPEADRGHGDRHERHQRERDPRANADDHRVAPTRPAGGPCSPRRAPSGPAAGSPGPPPPSCGAGPPPRPPGASRRGSRSPRPGPGARHG